ncbi:hypothetical protein AB1N83_003426 [Pleurotus pulmonarius]
MSPTLGLMSSGNSSRHFWHEQNHQVRSIFSAQEMPRTTTWCRPAVKHMWYPMFGVWPDITPPTLLPGSSPWNMPIADFISARCDISIIYSSREPNPGNFLYIPP